MVTKEWEETIKEINECRSNLKKHFGSEYPVNAIERLIMARIKLEQINNSNESKKEEV